MSKVENERIVIPSPADKLPPNPLLLGREPTSVAASSQRSSIASVDIPKEDKTLRNKLLKTDQRSFLTGVVSVDLQPAHILNTIRKAKPGSEAEVRKQEVEKLLNSQRILGIGKQFDLDCICNAFLLEASQHIWLDLYGAIAFIPIESQLDIILGSLNDTNTIWQHLVEIYGDRALSDRPLVRVITMEPQWQVLVLHPEAVCAERHPIRIRRDPYVLPADNPTNAHGSDPIIWDDYLPEDFILQRSSDGRKRVFVHDNTDKNFQLPTRRKADERISVLAMIINAASKLEHAIEKKYPCYQNPTIVNLRNKCSEICRQFFFQPKPTGVHMKDGSSSSVQDRTPTATQVSKGLFSSSSSDTANSGADGSSDVNMMQGDGEAFTASLSTSSDTSSTAALVDDGKVDGLLGQEVPAEDGLTNTEFRILSNKAVDPNLSAEERSRSAMLLLFGTQPYKVPDPSPF
ncbi:hypothetical protein K435DRAFT_969348 [Dendrothele bispora CBS 962.96]|uniref:Uncharacterized protein n=1 Tax=Dendrothele bispora (strain CBS 962.96) TaxID=1314807 RepID=A0A4V4HDY0_DENBC|nr:hypothetical protein K435DRAFT_969348 [Dendrothele bispora CBS 962.96]